MQLRLDFNTFVITGPSTDTTVIAKTLYGQPSSASSAVSMTDVTQCLTDMFSVTNPNGISPPVICGTNSGEHSTYHYKIIYYITYSNKHLYIERP